MTRTRVGVLRGGLSAEYEVSLKTGGAILKCLPEQYHGRDVLIDRNGKWHLDGVPATPQKIFDATDVIFNALHGTYGEDGEVQKLFSAHRVKHTGSGVLGSALAMQKPLAKKYFRKAGMKTPSGVSLKKGLLSFTEHAQVVFNAIAPPWFVKPAANGSSVGAGKARTLAELPAAIEVAFDYGDEVLVEELIEGREATCGVVENFRGQNLYALPVIEIVPVASSSFFDYTAKYDGSTKEICPGRFDRREKEILQDYALRAHKALGLRHYSRADFIVGKRDIYVLESNTLPGLTEQSLLPKALEAVGCSYPQFLDHLLCLALKT